MNYKKTYDRLYDLGYHVRGKNHGKRYAQKLTENYDFKKIIDVGCSNGLTVKSFQKLKKDAYGIDISSMAIRLATEKYGIRNCIEGNILDIPFKDNFFDAVFSCDVLEHLEPVDLKKAIQEISRITRKYLFLKISPDIEGNREYLDKAKIEYPDMERIDNLHLSVMPLRAWLEKIKIVGGVEYTGNCMDLMVFTK